MNLLHSGGMGRGWKVDATSATAHVQSLTPRDFPDAMPIATIHVECLGAAAAPHVANSRMRPRPLGPLCRCKPVAGVALAMITSILAAVTASESKRDHLGVAQRFTTLHGTEAPKSVTVGGSVYMLPSGEVGM